MRLRVFRGGDLAAAMSAVRRGIGENALILETREAEGGVEILAASDRSEADDPVRRFPDPLPIVSPRGSAGSMLQGGLASHGLSPALIARLLDRDLADSLAAALRFRKLPLERDDAPLVFAGEPGAGKTLSVIKAATRLVLDGQRPLVISTDEQKAGAIEQLASMTRLLGLTLLVATDPEQLRRALGRRTGGAPVLIDTPGFDVFSPSERMLLRDMRDAVEGEIVLVLPAGLDVAEAVELATAYASIGASLMLPTRLDVARRIGGILEPAFRSGLALTECGTGSDVARDLVPLTPELLADRLRKPILPLANPGVAPRTSANEQECPGHGSERRHAQADGPR